MANQFDSTATYQGKYAGGSWATGIEENEGLRPQFWANVLQANLTKNLVAMDITTAQLENQLVRGRSINMPYYDLPTSNSYAPGDTVEYENLGAEDDLLHVDKAEYIALELDDVQDLQNPYGRKMFTDSIVTPLARSLDKDILAHAIPEYYTDGATGTDVDVTMDGQPSKVIVDDLEVKDEGDIGHEETAIDLTSADVIYKVFSKAKRVLRDNDANIDELFAVVPPFVQEIAENALVDKGYQVADDTVRNGRVGRLMGIDIYGSTNFHDIDADNLSGTDDATAILVGQKNAINMVTQARPNVEMITTPETSFSTLFKAKQVWGSKVFHKDQDRLVTILAEQA